MTLAPGDRFDRYGICSRLGAGGMGEVYLAHDRRLGRPVALKLLLPHLSTSRDHARRFEQEARAASALNHPNILTIYEIGSFNSVNFIAAEFIDGETLRRWLAQSKRLSVNEAIAIAVQVAAALSAAHSAGILHRDVKPENIMLRKDGLVKLLDFGLAKLTEDLELLPAGVTDESTISEVYTTSGTVLGTVSYMSPEQLRGQPIDARTDIWSAGCVLYEMLVGITPFKGDSGADVIVSILERSFQPLPSALIKEAPELSSILSKAIMKDRNDRYQSIDQFRRDLETLRSTTGKERTGDAYDPADGIVNEAPTAKNVPQTNDVVSTTSAKRNAVTAKLQRNKGGFVALLIAVSLLASVIYGVYRQTRKEAPLSFRATLASKLVDTGNALDAAVSPDGKYVAYIVEEKSGQSIWGRQVGATSNAWPIIQQSAQRFSGLTFSPDANYILYIVFDPQVNQYVLYRTPALGGVSEKLLEDVDTPVTFSPDGKRMAFIRGYPSENRTALMLVDADGKREQRLASRPSPDDFGWKGGPAWSADGEWIACAVGRYESTMKLVAVRVSDGKEKELTSRSWKWVGRVSWVDNGKGLIFTAQDLPSSPPQIWFVSYPSGEARRISSDLTSYSMRGLSVTSNSSAFIAIQNNYLSSIWVLSKSNPNVGRRITATKSDGYLGLAWTPNGKIVFSSSASGNQDLWIMDPDGNNRKQLTSGGAASYQPAVSPDGRYVVFVSTRSGSQDLWRLDLAGGDLMQLTNNAIADWPTVSPDNRWVVYKGYASGKKTIWKISIDGGQPVQLTDKYSDWPAVSPDGKYVACEYWDEMPTTRAVLALIPFSGGAPITTFNFPPVTATSLNIPNNVIRWTKGGGTLTYIDGQTGVSNIVQQSLDGGKTSYISRFDSELIFWFDWAPDGNSVACSRGAVTSDVVLFNVEK
jgi:eukaryotic-like serine/threonine-protein kinase